ncbi:glucosamine-6-phosphate deaminase [uncultured Paludibaculum sp.]|uniref:glucosamine-6-phosphate deaminase n=1 Tax=uncultured Paludibaculum sp. TaxID=1765020 RepID=UPI002AABD796|nr:glucosamine-6-phosphate deaminase [uncultured Paludibaculum sp.]
MNITQTKSFQVGALQVTIFDDKQQLGEAAARDGAGFIRQAIHRRGRARIILSAANSQFEVVDALVATPGLDWSAVEVFHVDEWAGIPDTHSASFRRWVRERVAQHVRPAAIHYLAGDAPDMAAEAARYAALLAEAPIDVSFLGYGENGHIGFNDPHEADLNDPQPVRIVSLDDRCRRQQVGEGHFPNLEAVPLHGFTLTCPTLLSAEQVICCVPDQRKAEAVRGALKGPISSACPGSFLRLHTKATLYLDPNSASLLKQV